MKGTGAMECDKREGASAFSLKSAKHSINEDRYRMLSRDIPLVAQAMRGEVFAVFDGISDAPKGHETAQEMADCLIDFFRCPENYPESTEGLWSLIMKTNIRTYNWGFMPGTDQRSLAGAAGTIAWILGETLHVFHAGDTAAFLIRDEIITELTHAHQLESGDIYRYFGLGPFLLPTIDSFKIEEADRILLITDGVTKVFNTHQIGTIINNCHNRDRTVIEIVRRSRVHGSTDDITALMVDIEQIWE
jgi:PPM family protein phosphatase